MRSTFQVINKTQNRILASQCQVAVSFWSRLTGLILKKNMEVSEALWIPRCNSVHTFFMRFPIDVAFLDSSGRVVKMKKSLPPWRVTPFYFSAKDVLEMAPGSFEKGVLQLGDELLRKEVAG